MKSFCSCISVRMILKQCTCVVYIEAQSKILNDKNKIYWYKKPQLKLFPIQDNLLPVKTGICRSRRNLHMYVCIPIFVYLFYLFVYIHLTICWFVCLLMCLSVCPSVCSFILLLVSLFVCLLATYRSFSLLGLIESTVMKTRPYQTPFMCSSRITCSIVFRRNL